VFGDGEHDQALADGWRDFCRRLEEAGMRVFKDQNPPDPLQRADGFRYLTQNLGQAFDLALETRDTRYPAFHHFVSPSRKLGSDNADAVYLQAWIDGASVYRVSGRKGSARFWNFTIQGPRPATAALHDPFGDIPEANILGHELVTDDDGRFELFIGGGRQGANWLPTTPGSRKIFFRQFFDRWDEEPAQIAIERVDMAEPRPLPTPATMIEAMRWAGDFAFNVVDQWPDVLWRSGLIDPSAINRYAGANLRPGAPLSPEEEAQELRRGRVVTQMHWRLEPDQALILSFDAIDDFWMLTNEAMFGNSMDFAYRPVSYTPSRTAIGRDRRVRLVMAHRDPGFANWIDAQGFREGVLNFRNASSRAIPAFETGTVPLRELDRAMPEDAVRIDGEGRRRQMLERFHAIRRRFA